MAARKTTNRRSPKKTSQSAKAAQKTLGISPAVLLILIIFFGGIAYAAYLEANSNSESAVKISTISSSDKNDKSSANLDTEKSALQIHYIDVGQGDSSLIIFGDTTVLIDAGEKEMGVRVVDYLNELGIEKLDYIIATHPHSDHIGGLPEVINNLEIGTVIAPRVTAEMTPTTKTYENLLLALKGKGKKLSAAKAGTKYTLTSSDEKVGSAVMEIISPISPQSDSYDDLNDFSVVMKLTYKKTSYLFTGDASKPAESDILHDGADISADVLKVGHHGSSSASTAKFVNAVNPSICIIQCGVDNSYHHPHPSIVSRLNDLNADIYRTDLNGTVIVYSDGKSINVTTQKEN